MALPVTPEMAKLAAEQLRKMIENSEAIPMLFLGDGTAWLQISMDRIRSDVVKFTFLPPEMVRPKE